MKISCKNSILFLSLHVKLLEFLEDVGWVLLEVLGVEFLALGSVVLRIFHHLRGHSGYVILRRVLIYPAAFLRDLLHIFLADLGKLDFVELLK